MPISERIFKVAEQAAKSLKNTRVSKTDIGFFFKFDQIVTLRLKTSKTDTNNIKTLKFIGTEYKKNCPFTVLCILFFTNFLSANAPLFSQAKMGFNNEYLIHILNFCIVKGTIEIKSYFSGSF